MNTATALPMVIEAGRLYPIAEFRRITNLGLHAMRTARRNGLRVRYVGGRAFVHADDFLSFIDTLDADRV